MVELRVMPDHNFFSETKWNNVFTSPDRVILAAQLMSVFIDVAWSWIRSRNNSHRVVD